MSMDIDYRKVFNTSNIIRLIPILLLYTAQILLSYLPWRIIIQCMTGEKIPHLQTCAVFAKANIMKYIPGNVFQYVGRAELAQLNENMNITIVAASVIVETAATALAAIVVGVVGASEYTISLFKDNAGIFVILIFAFIIVLVFAIVFRNKISDLLKRQNIIITSKLLGGFFLALMFYVLTVTLNGLMLTYIMKMISEKNCFDFAKTICGAFSISWVAGYITPGASGGIGVREAVLVLLLGNTMTAGMITLAALILRFVNIIADLLAYGIILIIRRMQKT